VDVCRYEKGLQNMDQPKNAERKSPGRASLLQTQDLRVGQANEPCIRLIQENSIENSM